MTKDRASQALATLQHTERAGDYKAQAIVGPKPKTLLEMVEEAYATNGASLAQHTEAGGGEVGLDPVALERACFVADRTYMKAEKEDGAFDKAVAAAIAAYLSTPTNQPAGKDVTEERQ